MMQFLSHQTSSGFTGEFIGGEEKHTNKNVKTLSLYLKGKKKDKERGLVYLTI